MNFRNFFHQIAIHLFYHILHVKNKIITSVAKRNDTLIDYAVGKAGDMSKWINSNLSFVFGIDIAKDNIHNPLDGACARYLIKKKQIPNLFYALFVNGNSGLNIRSGAAMPSELGLEKDKQITKAVFGSGPKDSTLIGKGVSDVYGIGSNGFNISSCQFALHYMFQDRRTVHEFMRNLSECTNMNGYFIITHNDNTFIFRFIT